MAKSPDDVRDLDWNVVLAHKGETFRGTRGNDHLTGTDQADIFHMQQGGDDHVDAGGGRDTIYMGATLTPDDRINGGASYDTVVLDGDYSSGLTLQSNTLSRIESLVLQGAFDYSLTMAADMRFDKPTLVVDGQSAHYLYFDGSAMTVDLALHGSNGDDTLIGDSGSDEFYGGSGHDVMTGGPGQDHFGFNSTSDSLPSDPDVITNFSKSDGDYFYLANIDGDTEKKGHQDLHFGATPGHTGDVVVSYDANRNVTYINVFTDSDDKPDMTISLLGDHSDLTASDFVGVDPSPPSVAHIAQGVFGSVSLAASSSSHFDHAAHPEPLAHHLPIA